MKLQHDFTVTEEVLVPGNMTQYDISISRRPDGSILFCLYDDKTRHTGRVMAMTLDLEYAPYYFAEKMQCTIGDAGVLLTHLHKNYGINIHLDNRYNPDNGVWNGHVVQ